MAAPSPPRLGLSLCAGGGGLDLGLGLAEPGFATACYVELDDYPRDVLVAGQRAGYLEPAPIWDDLKTFVGYPWRGIVDTVLAGYPCQPFSQAGQRRGEDDPRHLFPHVARIIREVGPRWVFLENVSGHVSLGAETVLRELWNMGFTPAAGLFSASETGAPHERLRWFSVAYRSRDGRGGGAERDGRAVEPQQQASLRRHAVGRDTDVGPPRASDGAKGGPNMSFGAGGTPLPTMAAHWPTPAARDHKGENGPEHLANGTGRLHLDQLPNAVAYLFTHPGPVTLPHGLACSTPRDTWRRLYRYVRSTHGSAVARRLAARPARRLNPLFVEWLMGWPTGHALCACSETEFIRWQRRMRGALSRLPTASGAWIWQPPAPKTEPVQMSLFGGDEE